MKARSEKASPRSRGTILVAAMVVTALAAMVAAGLMFRMRSEMAAAWSASARQQANATAMSGLQRAMAVIAAAPGDVNLWYDNPDLFRNQLVLKDGDDAWYFTIYAENPADAANPRYGPIDEAAKINVNTASRETLMKLPNMTADMADSLLDYIDADNDPREQGAEQEYYSHLPSPYIIRNGPLGTIEELLLVKGFTGQVVYGKDFNFNGLLDRNEDDGDDSFPPDNRDGKLDTGLSGMATALSYERNVNSAGQPRININGGPDELAKLDGAGLPAQTVAFIKAYRQEGNVFRHPSELLEMQYQSRRGAASARPAQPKVESIEPDGADTAMAVLQGRSPVGGQGGTSSAVTGANLAVVLDKLTTAPNPRMPLAGMVNVNTASAKVLACLPGFDEPLAQRVVDARSAIESAQKSSIAWLVAQNVVDAAKFKEMAPYLTGRSLQFRLRCAGFAPASGRFCALEAVVDLATGRPRMLYLRDITRLGLPVAISPDQFR